MFGIKRKEEVFTTYNPQLFYSICQALSESQIPYETKTFHTAASNPPAGAFLGRAGSVLGRVGQLPEQNIQYFIYTAPKDAEWARHSINAYRQAHSL